MLLFGVLRCDKFYIYLFVAYLTTLSVTQNISFTVLGGRKNEK